MLSFFFFFFFFKRYILDHRYITIYSKRYLIVSLLPLFLFFLISPRARHRRCRYREKNNAHNFSTLASLALLPPKFSKRLVTDAYVIILMRSRPPPTPSPAFAPLVRVVAIVVQTRTRAPVAICR
uniref:Uncharacterized protein n=1 Tax=Sipha flava TaxID=143950 RepID=A0A2S2QLI5_9HEMI